MKSNVNDNIITIVGTLKDKTIRMPAFMLTAASDAVLDPVMTTGMENWCAQLSRGNIENAAHW